MKNVSNILKINILVYTLVIAVQCFGQSNTGTTIGQFLLIEPSARYAAMGNTGVASADEITAAYYNPAAIGRLSGTGLQFTHSLWIADITYDYAIAMVDLGELGNLFFNVTALNSGDIDVRTVEQPLGTGEKYTVSNVALGVGYGRRLTDRFSMGVQINYIQETIFHSSLSTVSLSVGTMFDLTRDGLVLGASISNYGLPAAYSGRDLRIQYDLDKDKYGDNSGLPGDVHTEEYPLPVLFRVGLSYPFQITEDHKMQFSVNAYHPNDNTESVSMGMEWEIFKTLALRSGYQNLFLKDSEVGLTAGLGLNVAIAEYQLNLDYAWADFGRLQNTQRFTLGILF
ncbi:MAG: PorV/PorQ family protein [Calditrichaeota bacterium]|nr:PorV/PorQ family protein [Calditrichota bacterium]